MHVDDAREQAFQVLLVHRQNRVLLEHGDNDDLDQLQSLLAEAEETITYWMVDASLAHAQKQAGIAEHILSAYAAEWSAIENGHEFVQRIEANLACAYELCAIAAQIDRSGPC